MNNTKIGDKFILEIESIFEDDYGNRLYRVKNFKSLVFDEIGLSKLKRIEPVQLYKDYDNQNFWISDSEIKNIDKVIRYVYHSDKDEDSAIEVIKK